MLSSAESKATGTTRIIYGAVYYMAAAVTEDDMASLIYLVHKHQSSQLNTASVYYLLDLSSFSLLSPLFSYYSTSVFSFFSFLCSLIFGVPSLYVKPAANS